jgi:hypothetical protein
MNGLRKGLVIAAVGGSLVAVGCFMAAMQAGWEYLKFRHAPVGRAVILGQNLAKDGRVDSVDVRLDDGRPYLLVNIQHVPREDLSVGSRVQVRTAGREVVPADLDAIVRDSFSFGLAGLVVLGLSGGQWRIVKRIAS